MGNIVAIEIEHSADVSQVEGPVVGQAGSDELYKVRSHTGAVGNPQLIAVGAVVGREVDLRADLGELVSVGIARAGIDIFEQIGARVPADSDAHQFTQVGSQVY